VAAAGLTAARLDELRALVGPGQVSTDPAVVLAASRDSSYRSQKLARLGRAVGVADAVVAVRDTAEVARVLAWCGTQGVPVTPRGPGSGVMGSGIPTQGGVLLDVRGLNQVLQIDVPNGRARVQGGVLLSDLEDALQPWGLTGGHYPQSLHLASVAGGIAMRGTGTFSSLYGSVEDRLAELTVVLPSGAVYQSHNAPRASTGPDLRQLFLGSEGTLGVITEVTLKVVPIPASRRFAAYGFARFEDSLAASRDLLAAGVVPAVLRVYDPVETQAKHAHFATAEGTWLMILLFEGDPELTATQARIAERLGAGHGGRALGEEPARTWLEHRFDVSWMSDQVARDGGVAEAVEVCATWSALPGLLERMRTAAARTMTTVMAHVSHIYSDGASLYVIASGDYPSDEAALAAYDQLWADLMPVVLEAGAVISHHHGIGVERAGWMAAQLGAPGLDLLRGLKAVVDPAGVMNPGKLGL
jgi:alkyldihydroxyacetonephosphate synthase